MTTYPFRSALVTGASSGIGEEITRQLRTAGLPVVAVARRTDRLEALAGELGEIEVLTADLRTDEGQRSVAERVADGDHPIDLVVNNAGFGTSGPLRELDVDRLLSEVDVNVAALTRITHAAASVMVPRGRGWILNVSSVAGFQPAPSLAVYASTKAYVTCLTESLHEELRGTGVHVTALCPGLTRTEFQSVSSATSYQDQYPSWVWIEASDVAAAGLADVVRNRALSVPGPLYKAMVGVASITPHRLRRLASGLVRRR